MPIWCGNITQLTKTLTSTDFSEISETATISFPYTRKYGFIGVVPYSTDVAGNQLRLGIKIDNNNIVDISGAGIGGHIGSITQSCFGLIDISAGSHKITICAKVDNSAKNVWFSCAIACSLLIL